MTEVVRLEGLAPGDAPALLRRLLAARLACFPTDTVYGVGGALRPEVAAAIVAAKGRPEDKPLQVIFGSLAALERALRPSPALARALRRLLPGPVTAVVPYPAGWDFPPPGPGGTLGVRVPDWPAAARCLTALPEPLIASSANPSGAPPPASLDAVDAGLLARCDLALDAGPVAGVASTVVDLGGYEAGRGVRLLRVGVWDEREVAARLAGDGEG